MANRNLGSNLNIYELELESVDAAEAVGAITKYCVVAPNKKDAATAIKTDINFKIVMAMSGKEEGPSKKEIRKMLTRVYTIKPARLLITNYVG